MTQLLEKKNLRKAQNKENGPSKRLRSTKKAIPKNLIYEEIDGNPIYYRGYEQVIKNKKTIEDIMGSSVLQSIIIRCILKNLNILEYLNKDFGYIALTNELGIHLNLGNNLSADIAIYEKNQLKDLKLTDKYIEIPPKIIIEVDTKADLNNFDSTMDYIKIKTKKLFEFGVEKIFWILSKNQQIIAAVPNDNWLLMEWDKEIKLTQNIKFSLKDLLDKEEIKY